MSPFVLPAWPQKVLIRPCTPAPLSYSAVVSQTLWAHVKIWGKTAEQAGAWVHWTNWQPSVYVPIRLKRKTQPLLEGASILHITSCRNKHMGHGFHHILLAWRAWQKKQKSKRTEPKIFFFASLWAIYKMTHHKKRGANFQIWIPQSALHTQSVESQQSFLASFKGFILQMKPFQMDRCTSTVSWTDTKIKTQPAESKARKLCCKCWLGWEAVRAAMEGWCKWQPCVGFSANADPSFVRRDPADLHVARLYTILFLFRDKFTPMQCS